MDGRRTGARAVLLVALAAWHVAVVFALLPRRPREPVVVECVSTLLQLDEARPAGKPDALRVELARASAFRRQLMNPVGDSPVLEQASGTGPDGTRGPAVDWNADGARAARSVGEAMPVPAERPANVPRSYWSQPHRKGEQVPAGPGQWLVWVSEHCYTIIDQSQTPVAGRPMSARCPKQQSPIDAETLLIRRPRYLGLPDPGSATGR